MEALRDGRLVQQQAAPGTDTVFGAGSGGRAGRRARATATGLRKGAAAKAQFNQAQHRRPAGRRWHANLATGLAIPTAGLFSRLAAHGPWRAAPSLPAPR